MAEVKDVWTAQAAQGRRVDVADTQMNFIIRSTTTESKTAVHEWTVPPRSIGAPPHIHLHDDEFFYVLEGEVTVMEEDAVTTAGPGAYVVLPRGRMHTFWNATDAPARMIVILTPGHMEGFFEGASKTIRPDAPPDIAEANRLAEEHGLVLRMDLMPALMAKYGLTSVLAPPNGGSAAG